MKAIYLDYAAATPLDVRVLKAMQPFFADQFYNPSSPYQAAKHVKAAVEDARARVAHWLGAKPGEIIFTAGATESVNIAINGVMLKHPDGEVLVSATEHHSVTATVQQYAHGIIPVLGDGTVDLAVLKKLISDKTVLISVLHANNEVGTVQPLSDIAKLIQEQRKLRRLKNNPLPLYLHTDASQSPCYLDIHASRLGVDLLTLNGAKMHGPKQTGILFVSANVELGAVLHGGGQERGLRSGTENVAGIVGFATALDIAQSERKEAVRKVAILRDELQTRLSGVDKPRFNGNQKRRLPNLLHVSWPGIDGERLVMLLDEQGVMASTGSACAANKQTASHVLKAVGLSADLIAGSLRLSLGRQTTQKEIAKAAEIIAKAVQSLR